MRAVRAGHSSLVEEIAAGTILSYQSVAQDKSREIRYTRNSDFTDEIARQYLARNLDSQTVGELMKARPGRELLRPRFI
jgi:hypothetical protein